jgi:ubiquinone/menaquinone biosynthesis C-methylase UbiE
MTSWSRGEIYEPFMGRWSRLVAPAFLSWLDRPPGARWLDVGCGTGALSSAIIAVAEPSSVVGVDASPDFVDFAAKHLTDPRVSFRAGDAQALPVADGSVEVVVSALLLNFLQDRRAALREMRRATTAGGTVAAYVWDYSGQMRCSACSGTPRWSSTR